MKPRFILIIAIVLLNLLTIAYAEENITCKTCPGNMMCSDEGVCVEDHPPFIMVPNEVSSKSIFSGKVILAIIIAAAFIAGAIAGYFVSLSKKRRSK